MVMKHYCPCGSIIYFDMGTSVHQCSCGRLFKRYPGDSKLTLEDHVVDERYSISDRYGKMEQDAIEIDLGTIKVGTDQSGNQRSIKPWPEDYVHSRGLVYHSGRPVEDIEQEIENRFGHLSENELDRLLDEYLEVTKK